MGKFNLFTNLRTPKDISNYTLFRGTTDWSALQQFNLYEQGYPYLVLVNIPEFLQKLMDSDDEISKLISTYTRILEYEFTGLDNGIEDFSVEDLDINNNIQTMNVIGKVNGPGSTTFSMEYNERAGGVISKAQELYLRSIRDTGSGFKTYNGLIGRADANGNLNADDRAAGAIYTPDEVGFDKEAWSFLYMHTDPSGLALEQAIYYVGCYPTGAPLQQYIAKRGDVQFSAVSVEFRGFPIRGAAVNYRAKQILDYMNDKKNNLMVRRNSWDFNYRDVGDTQKLGKSSLVGSGASYNPKAYRLNTVGSNGLAANQTGELPYIRDMGTGNASN